MRHKPHRAVALAAACVAVVVWTSPAGAQGKIVCWKDKAGKVIGCGDSVPPEYQQNASKELDKRGVTRKTVDSAEEVARQRAQAEQAAKAKAESDRRDAEQRRQDGALLATYASEQEIDAKRDRDLQVVNMQLEQVNAALKSALDRRKDLQTRLDAAQKSKKGAGDALKDEVSRAGEQVKRLEQTVAAKEKEKDDIRARYADYRKRYAELKTGGGASSGRK